MTENHQYLTTQLITYIGNKRALLPFILEAVVAVKQALGRDKISCADMFAGSGVVARGLRAHASHMVVNDLEGYCQTLARCYFSNSTGRDMPLLRQMYDELRATLSCGLTEGFISRLYAPADAQSIQPGERCFYTPRNARYIDTARQAIGALPQDVQHFFLAPLLCQASVKANTAGVFKGFYKDSQTGLGRFGGRGENALGRICGDIELPFPVFSAFDCPTEIYRRDALSLARQMEPVDLMYLDPPYNQHPYGSNYFMLNLINEYKEPAEISAVSGIPKGWNRSDFNVRARALPQLAELCSTARARFLLISFNSEGFISPGEMEAALGRLGRLTVMEQKYNAFRGSRNLRGREIHTSEYLFLLDKAAGAQGG